MEQTDAVSFVEVPQTETRQLVEKLLSPRLETDNAGFIRKVYEYNGITFSFRGREEFPTYSTFNESDTTILGEMPRLSQESEYQEYINSAHAGQIEQKQARHYSATKSLLGVVDLALALGSHDERLIKIKADLQNDRYGSEALELIDQLVACNYVRNGTVENTPDIDAEAVVILSLLGNEEATHVVNRKVAEIEELDHQKPKLSLPGWVPEKPLEAADFVCVHATSYKPEEDFSGNYLVKTTSDALGGITIRNTVHVSLNHRVSAHEFGSWSQMGYVILAPLDKMINENGLPESLDPVDSWWTRSPGEPLRFPDATLISSGGYLDNQLILEEGRVVRIKSEGYKKRDILRLYDLVQKEGLEKEFLEVFQHQVYGAFFTSACQLLAGEKYQNSGFNFGPLIKTLEKRFGEYNEFNRLRKGVKESETEMYGFIYGGSRKTDGSLDDGARERVFFSDIPQSIEGLKPELREGLLQELADKLTGTVKGWLYSELNEYAVREAIRKRGARVTWGSKNESGLDAEAGYLFAQMGGPISGLHSSSDQGQLEGKFRNAVNHAYTEEQGGFDWKKFDSDNVERGHPFEGERPGLVSGVNRKTRRVLYASGLLNARYPQDDNRSSEDYIDNALLWPDEELIKF